MRLVLALVVLLILLGGGALWWWNWAVGAAQPGARTPVRLTIQSGDTVRSVGRALETKGVIRSARAFGWLGRDVTIHPGAYDFSPSETPAEILRHLRNREVATIRVTIPEGFTNRQIAARLKAQGVLSDEKAFLDFVTTQGATLRSPRISPPADLQGYLFPDTYKIPIGANPARIAGMMVETFLQRLEMTYRSESGQNGASHEPIRPSPTGRSLADAVNIAAMIEREAEVDADRPLIASVIDNRLARGMKLQIDATVQYARGRHVARLLYRDLEVDSPYNTYKHAGLPPGSICNPGLPSLKAALNPARTDYLYYVGRPGQSHRFARTYAEHQQNIALVRRENAAAKAKPEKASADAR